MAGGHGGHTSIDVLRKVAIVVVLVAAVLLLHRFAVPAEDFDPRGLLALGFVVLAAYTIGELAEVIKLPHITGYLLAGLLLGPSTAHIVQDLLPEGYRLIPPFDEGILNERVKAQLVLLDDLALALIALTAGGELKLEGLRKGLKQILGVLGGQIIAILLGVTGFMYLISGVIPAIALEPLMGTGTAGALALGAVVAAVSLATSPAATIAIINGSRAKGEMTSTILSVVVLKDVVVVVIFSAAIAVATGVLGVSDGGGGFLASLGHIALSIVMGVVLGLLIDLYLRYVGAELLLFLVGVIYTTTFVAHQLHAEAALVFIVAGFVTSNFSDRGETLIHEVERLSSPVYVVFFTLAGAKLHLDVLWAMIAFALGLVAVRAGTLYLGVRAGARLTGAAPVTSRFGWMGFVSQAGLAITLANTVAGTFPGETGTALFSLILGGVAVNEIIGPVMLQWGLGLAGETEAGDEEEEEEAEVTEERRTVEVWKPPADLPDPWGPQLRLQAPSVNEVVDELEIDLQGLIRDLARGPLEELREDAEDYLRSLRREFLRFHRRAVVRVQTGEPVEGLVAFLRGEVGDLGERWRDLVLARAARVRRPDQWSPMSVVEVIDGLAEELPDIEEVPVEPETLVPHPDEGPMSRLRRGLLRARARISPPNREISTRTLGRYHLAGRAPARLEGLAALLVNADLHLAGRTSYLFDTFAETWGELATLAESGVDQERFLEAMWNVRREIDDDFNVAFDELDHIVADGANRAALALGGLLQDMKHDLVRLGTLDLPHWRRRPGRVFRERNRGLDALTTGLRGARGAVGSRYSALALELELVGLEGRVRDVVEVHGSQIARLIRGRGTTQLERVDSGLTETLGRVETRVEDPEIRADELASALRAEAEPFARLVGDATRSTTGLIEQLQGEAWISPLTVALMTAAQDLTEWYTVPTGRTMEGEWSLPNEVATAEVPFREVVVGYIEASVTRDLLELTRDLEEKASTLLAVLHDLERVVAFNIELACAELDVLPPGELIGEETRDLVREMVLGAVGRSQARLRRMVEESIPWAAEAHEGVRHAVVHELEDLRGQVLDGRITELRLFLMREREVGARLVRRAGEWRGLVPQFRERGITLVRRALGQERLEAARVLLGLPEEAWERPLHVALAPRQPSPSLPLVYRRLFSDQALEAGDLLTGRQEEVGRVRQALEGPASGRFRSAALIGPDETGIGAIVNAVVRGVDARSVRRIEPEGPVSVEEVASWFEAEEREELVVIVGLHWLFQLEPGGFAPLMRLVDGIVADGGRTRWLLASDQSVWTYASRAAPLADAMAAEVSLRPLGADELASAIMSRHSMSGYEVEFRGREDVGWQLEHLLLRGRDREKRGQSAWFRTLHSASGGVMHDALRLWMASVEEVDEAAGVLRIGRVPRPPLTRLGKLPVDQQLTLLQLLRQGWMTPQILAGQLRVGLTEAQARLAGMAHQGLIVQVDGRYRIVSHLRMPIERVLRGRGWAP